MTLIVNTEAHFSRGPDGIIRSSAANASFSAWTQYHAVSDCVIVVGRVTDRRSLEGYPVEGPGVRVHPVPGYKGLRGTLTSPIPTLLSLRSVTRLAPAVFTVRLPSIVGGLMILLLRLRRRHYAVELIGDPYDVFRSGIVSRALGVVGSHVFLAVTRWQCSGARTANYVTSRTLQARYPARRADSVFSFSDVELAESAVPRRPRTRASGQPVRLAMVGTMSQPYKGHHVLVEALRILKSQGLQFDVSLAGEGQREQAIRAQVSRAGLGREVEFVGQLDRSGVEQLLDHADIFVMPSLTEGMPRALIEAMAHGLPCVASRVGGVPELLDPKWCVEPGNPTELAAAIGRLATADAEYSLASEANLRQAQLFRADCLGPQRAQFYARLKRLAEEG